MEKLAIDQYFTDNEVEIKKYIESMFCKRNLRSEEGDYFFTEIYLYCLNLKDEIDDDSTLKKYVSTFIYNHTRWKNSKVREMGNSRTVKFFEFNANVLDSADEDYEPEEDLDYEAINELYYQSLTTMEEKAVWEIYFLQGKTTHLNFGNFIKRSNTVGGRYVNWLRADLKRFFEEYKVKINK